MNTTATKLSLLPSTTAATATTLSLLTCFDTLSNYSPLKNLITFKFRRKIKLKDTYEFEWDSFESSISSQKLSYLFLFTTRKHFTYFTKWTTTELENNTFDFSSRTWALGSSLFLRTFSDRKSNNFSSCFDINKIKIMKIRLSFSDTQKSHLYRQYMLLDWC